MKINHVWHAYHPIVGGLELTVQHLAEEQARSGHEVSVITSDACSSRSAGAEELNGVKIRTLHSLKLFYNDLTFPLKIPNIDADIMHLHSQNSLFCLKVAQQGKKKNIPIVYQFLGVNYLKAHPKQLIRLFGSRYQGWIQTKALILANRIVTPSPKGHRVLEDQYKVSSEMIPHGIGHEYLQRPSSSTLFREKYNIFEEKIILFIGRLDPLKGIDILIRSLPYLEQIFTDYTLVIIGTGCESYLRGLLLVVKELGVEHRVRFLGYVEENVKISALDASNIVALPSVASFETFPLVINEAWARRKPVVVSSVGALPYRVEHMKNGVLVLPENPKLLAESISEILKDQNLQNRLGNSGREELKTWEEVSALTIKLYEDCL